MLQCSLKPILNTVLFTKLAWSSRLDSEKIFASFAVFKELFNCCYF